MVDLEQRVLANIKQLRILRQYSQHYLAYKLGITQAAYSKVESGFSKIIINRLHSIANVLGIETYYLLKFDMNHLIHFANNQGEQ